jgi:hypothetical protein
MVESAPMMFREGAAIVGGGAAAGAGGQAVSDVVNRRLSPLADYAGSAVGGSAGALTSIYAPARYAGMASGAVTSMAQDAFHGRVPTAERAMRTAQFGGLFGAGAGRLGAHWADNLGSENPGVRGESQAKGELGESLSRLRLLARGDPATAAPKSRAQLTGGGYTYPDIRTRSARPIESKFGRSAVLSPRQRQAYEQPLDGYTVLHFITRDVGAMAGFPASLFGSHIALGGDELSVDDLP